MPVERKPNALQCHAKLDYVTQPSGDQFKSIKIKTTSDHASDSPQVILFLTLSEAQNLQKTIARLLSETH